jgi:4-amino-4-deoxy-L-arabinose transferase-like glycosyltransferase
MGHNIRRLIILSVLGIIVRVGFLAIFGGFDQKLYDSITDQETYIDIAHNLASGNGFETSAQTWIDNENTPTSIMPPLFPMMLAASFKLFGETLVAVRIISILLSLIVLISIYLLSNELFGQLTATITGVIWVFYPTLVMYVRPIMSETLFLPFIALLVLCTYYIGKPNSRWWLYLIWGVIAGLGILTRTEMAFLLPILLFYILVRKFIEWVPSRNRYGKLFASIAVPTVVTLAVLVPYGFYNQSAHGVFSLLPNAKWKLWDHTWWAAHRDLPLWNLITRPEIIVVPNWNQKTEVERDAYLWDMAITFVKNNPQEFLAQRVQRLLWSYPVLPREEFSPPFGTKKTSVSANNEPSSTSLDDVVPYDTLAQKVRVWGFRIVFLLAVLGTFLILRKRQYAALLTCLVVLWNLGHSMLFVGSERLRSQIDPYLIVLAASYVSYLWLTFKSRKKVPSVREPKPANQYKTSINVR